MKQHYFAYILFMFVFVISFCQVTNGYIDPPLPQETVIEELSTQQQEKIHDALSAYECAPQFLQLQQLIERIDTILYKQKNTTAFRAKIHTILSQKRQAIESFLGKKYTDYLLRYYDKYLFNDFFNGCLDTNIPNWSRNSFFRGWHEILQGYTTVVREQGYENCIPWMGGSEFTCEDEVIYEYNMVYFVVTNKEEEHYDKNFWKKDATVPLWCLRDNTIFGGQEWLFKPYNKTLVKDYFFSIPEHTTKKLLESSQEAPITIAGVDHIFVNSSDHGNIKRICWWAFPHISIIE